MSIKTPPIATVVNGHTFTVDSRYVLKDSKILGKGSFGVVCTAYDSVRKIDLAIKRIRPYANDDWDARHTLREIRLLKLLGPHPNIISIYELSLFEPKTELYMMMELMDCDLHRVIQSKQALSEKHHKCFLKQMLEGIKAMHSIGVFHRDLKPGNLLVSKDCQLRITDFGLARFMDENTRQGHNDVNPMTEYVVTRWYRCPELLLAPNQPYSEAIDLWSIGCIFAELLRRKPIFPGKSHTNQVQLIFEAMGYNNQKELGFTVSPEAASFLDKRCRYRKQPIKKYVPDASDEAINLLTRLLSVNPSQRPSAVQALQHPFLNNAEILNDYSKQYLSRPSPDFFEFEQAKFSVPMLKHQVELEVELSAADAYRNNTTISNNTNTLRSKEEQEAIENIAASNASYSAAMKAAAVLDNHTVRNAEETFNNKGGNIANTTASEVESDGPASQLPTQIMNKRTQRVTSAQNDDNTKSNPFRSTNNQPSNTTTRPRSSENISEQAAAYRKLLQNSKSSSDVTNNDISYIVEKEGFDPVPLHSIPQGDNILTAVRNETNSQVSRNKNPKSPSPKKVSVIKQKDLNNKRRFLLQQEGIAVEDNVDTARSSKSDNTNTKQMMMNMKSQHSNKKYGLLSGQNNTNNNAVKRLGRFVPTVPVPFPSLTGRQITQANRNSNINNAAAAAAMRHNNGGGSDRLSSHSHDTYDNNDAVMVVHGSRSKAMMQGGSNVINR